VSATFLYFQLKRIPAARRGEISVTPLTNGNAVFDATISQDGKYFVYHEADQDKVHLWLQQTGKTGRIEIIPPGERIINGKTFSPNGEFVYFVGQEKGEVNYSLYRVPTFGGPMTKILADIASPVSFSPDGSEMAFARYNDKTKESQLVVAAADGGRERILVTRPGVGALSIGNTWSPDGKFIAFGAIDLAARRNEGTCSIATLRAMRGNGPVIGTRRTITPNWRRQA
jgi:Tol biopolymer transport system component